MIRDAAGGILRLDLAQAGMDDVGHACRALLESKLAPGTCLIRVWAGDELYRLRQVTRDPFSLGLARMDAPEREVTIPEEVLREALHLLDETKHLRAASLGSRSSLISYML
jgi:hypothetical protein